MALTISFCFIIPWSGCSHTNPYYVINAKMCFFKKVKAKYSFLYYRVLKFFIQLAPLNGIMDNGINQIIESLLGTSRHVYHKAMVILLHLAYEHQKWLALCIRIHLDNVTWVAPALLFMWISRNDSKVDWPQKQTKLSKNGRKIVGYWRTKQIFLSKKSKSHMGTISVTISNYTTFV